MFLKISRMKMSLLNFVYFTLSCIVTYFVTYSFQEGKKGKIEKDKMLCRRVSSSCRKVMRDTSFDSKSCVPSEYEHIFLKRARLHIKKNAKPKFHIGSLLTPR